MKLDSQAQPQGIVFDATISNAFEFKKVKKITTVFKFKTLKSDNDIRTMSLQIFVHDS